MSTDTQKAETLLDLARERFKDLTPAEEKLFRSVATGKWANYKVGDAEKDKPANAKEWGDDRTLAADRIAWLCTDKQARDLVMHGGIDVRGARIEGQLDLDNIDISFWLLFIGCVLPDGMKIRQARVKGIDLNGSRTGPIKADGVRVAGSVFLRGNFISEGEVRLLGAEIGGNLECDKSQFSNSGSDALVADGIKVAGSVFLRDGFKAAGGISLVSAEIGHYLICTGVDSAAGMTLDLRSARVGTFWDDKISWPHRGNLYLYGFLYERLFEKAPRDAKSRIGWLQRQPTDQFLPQPYEQLADVLRKGGHESDAKKILIAKNNDPARRNQMRWYQKIWRWFYYWTVAFGYRPERALIWIAGLLCAGWSVFGIGYSAGCIQQLSDKVPAFNPFIYSLDTLLPIVDLQQEKYWFPASGFPASYLWVHIMAGWLLVSVFIAGLTRSVRS